MTINFDSSTLDVIVDDRSYRNRRIMGEHAVYLTFSLPEHVEIPIGAWIEYEGLRYTLDTPSKIIKHHNRNFEYTLTLESPEAKLKKYKIRNTVDGRLKFPFTGRPQEHLQLLVDNVNAREGGGWSIGEYLDSSEKLVSYSHDFISDGLVKIAAAFETEFEVIGQVINLRKVEHAKNNPISLSYGKNNGLLSGTGRQNFGEGNPIEVLYIQGGERNINFADYNNQELLLPKSQTIKYDGSFFEGESGYNSGNAREYITDPNGLYIKRNDKPLLHHTEDSLDLSNIYPHRQGSVSSVTAVNPANNLYDFADTSIPASLDYNNTLTADTMTVYFESGMLAGRTFDVSQYVHSTRTFKIVPAVIDGVNMPSDTWKPAFGDKYVILNISMPQAYIGDNSSKTGAEWDMYRGGVRYLYDNEEQKFTITGEVDSIWSSKNWLNIGGRLKLGYYVRYSDPNYMPLGVDIRIVGIKDYLNNPQKPKIELSNNGVTGGVSSTLKQISENEVLVETSNKQNVAFTKRRYRDAVETMKLIEETMSEYFTSAINPAAVHTMSLLVGHESLQFRFVNNKTNPDEIIHTVTYNNDTKVLSSPAGIIQHMTIGITDISSSHKVSDYLFWDIPEFNSPPLVDGDKAYWLYARVSKSNQSGEFVLTDAPLTFDVAGYYNLWVGVLNTEYLEERSYVDLYGFTEILPGRITTKRIVSEDGLNWFDFVANSVRIGNETVMLNFNSEGDGLFKLLGAIVQSPSGAEDVLGVYIGDYDPLREYFRGDVVDYTDFDGNKARYKYINPVSAIGNLPTDTDYWIVEVSDGRRGGAVVYRGIYDPDTVYTGSNARIDVVKYGTIFFEARASAGDFIGTTPTTSGNEKWRYFGASFSSVATDLLLADKAALGNWWIEGGKIVSRLLEDGDDFDIPRMSLDAEEVEIVLTQGGNEFPNKTTLNKRGVVVQNGNYVILEGDSGSGNQVFAESAISGYGKGAVNRSSESEPFGASFVAGMYGCAFNSGTAPAFGGYFENIFINGFNAFVRRINSNVTITPSDVFLSVYANCTITLPSYYQSSRFLYIRINGNYSVTINGNGKQILPPASGAVNSLTVSTRGELVTLVWDGLYWLSSTTAQ